MGLPKKRNANAEEAAATEAPAAEVVETAPEHTADTVQQDPPWEEQEEAAAEGELVDEPVAQEPEPEAEPAPDQQQETVRQDAAQEDAQAPLPAKRPTGTAMAAPSSASMISTEDAAAAGFQGMEMDWSSLPTIKLDKGAFKSSDGLNLGTEFMFTMAQSRVVYIVKNGAPNGSDDEDFVFSAPDDGATKNSCTMTTTGLKLEDIRNKWRSRGYDKHEFKKYLNVVVEVLDGDMAGEAAMLSIPPSSIGRFGALRTKLPRAGYSVEQMTEATLSAEVGPEVGKGQKAFNPWVFNVAG